MSKKKSPYYYIRSKNKDRMMLYNLPEFEDWEHNDWSLGRPFTETVSEPVCMPMQEEAYDERLGSSQDKPRSVLLPFFNDDFVSNAFYEAMLEAGVTNVVAYDAVIENEDASIQHKGYKALNILGGRISSDKEGCFSADAKLYIKPENNYPDNPFKPEELLVFRTSGFAFVIHEKLKDVLEAKGFHSLEIWQPSEW